MHFELYCSPFFAVYIIGLAALRDMERWNEAVALEQCLQRGCRSVNGKFD
jgi:hypothetical protein